MADIVYVKGQEWQDLRKKLVEAGHNVYKAQDRAVGNVAALARPKVFEGEESAGIKHNELQRKLTSHGVVERQTKWNSETKSYVGSRGVKLVSFSFENLASRYKNGKLKLGVLSRARLISRVANLWENDTKPYQKTSPWFSRGVNKKGAWQANKSRPGKKTLVSKMRIVAEESVPLAIKKVLNDESIWRTQ